MSGPGAIFKRCGCREAAGRRLNNKCPRLAKRGHGTWTFHASATNLLGRSERVRRGGYPSQASARRARDEWLAATGADRTARSWTVEQWLRYWLSARTAARGSSPPVAGPARPDPLPSTAGADRPTLPARRPGSAAATRMRRSAPWDRSPHRPVLWPPPARWPPPAAGSSGCTGACPPRTAAGPPAPWPAPPPGSPDHRAFFVAVALRCAAPHTHSRPL
jgi:hypothetical protein